MSMNHVFDKLREPLHETTRKIRRNLLMTSVIGVVVTKVGLIPTKISVFGIEFSYSNQQALMMLLAVIIIYFGVSFLVYVYSELSAWKVLLASKDLEEVREQMNNAETVIFGTVSTERIDTQTKFLSKQTQPVFLLRLLIEVGVPVLLASYSCYLLATTEPPKNTNPISSVHEPANKHFKMDAQKAARPLN
jgi:hypothetical protein